MPRPTKMNLPLRPIFAAYNTASYRLSKFLVPLLTPFTVNDYTVKDSFAFVDEIANFDSVDKYYMASFEILFLFLITFFMNKLRD